MRCFIALDIEEDAKANIAKLQDEIKDYDVKLVEKKNLHFTLKFLGDIDKAVIEQIKTSIDDVAKSTQPFEISLHGIGVFPSINYMRVIWIGDENKELYNLQLALEEHLSGFFKKEEPSPHLTIARVRTPKNKKELNDFINKNKYIWLGKIHVKEIQLKRSYLGNRGPKYEDIEIFKLGE